MSPAKLLNFPEDILISIFTFLNLPDILNIRQTCRRLNDTANLKIVWLHTWETHILHKWYPFPAISSELFEKNSREICKSDKGRTSIQNMSRAELEQRTRHAYRLGKRDIRWVVSPSIAITDIRFVRSVRYSSSKLDAGPADESILVLSVSKGIWSVITIWDVPIFLHGNDNNEPRPRKCAEWSLKGGLFTGLCLSRDHGSEADLAVSVVCEGRHEIDLFNISDVGELLPICTVPSVPMCASTLGEEANIHSQAMQPMKPMTLSGSLLAMSDDTASTVIYNWKTGAFAVLEHEEDEIGVWKHDHIIQVVFAYRSVLVVRARSLHLFPEPELYLASPSSVANSNFLTSPGLPNIYSPIANHSFGWVDGVSVVSMYPDCSSDNPWMSNEHSLDLYELSLNPNFFPPICTSRVTSSRGPLRCTDLILGRCGTAMWVKPGDRTTHGLLASDMYDDYTYVARLGGLESGIVTMGGGATESLVAGIFPGPLNPDETVRTRKIYTNVSKDWTALDYDEAIGRVVLGDATGCVRILEL
ncbi:hypothetical protein LENED_002959 [Lentinula edodes]|uniref:F-box domain-containing protein n=1 Tax=Lentinula edodes TaxID=5353 RepID=A0A1Q3E2W5_LENED|nr:hypothetical protein LENED_002959 [Lentinula edodes]